MTEERVVLAIEKEMASTFVIDFICICLRASKISEKCDGKKMASPSDMAILTSKNHGLA